MRTPIRAIRLTDKHWEAFKLHLGMSWLRKQIEKAEKKANAPAAHTKTTKE